MQLLNNLDSIKLPANQALQYTYRNQLNVLFINPEITGANYYKMILPYAVLKDTGVINTAITGYEKYNPIKRFRNDDKSPISSVQVIWSDTIVLPFTNQPLFDFIEMAKTINPNTLLAYHVDFDFIDLPDNHPLKDAFPKEKVDIVIKNIMAADRIIVTNAKLASHLITRLQEMGNDIGRDKFGVQFLCADESIMLDSIRFKQSKDDTFTLCVLAGDNQWSDVEACIPAILEAKKKHKNNLKIVFFGVNKNKDGWSKLVKGLEYVPEGAVPIWKYYQKLADINPHLVLVPSDKSEFTIRSTDYKRYIDCGLLEIPIITPNVNPFDAVIKSGENGYTYDDDQQFSSILDELIANPKQAAEAGGKAKINVEDNFSYNQDKLQRLINLLG